MVVFREAGRMDLLCRLGCSREAMVVGEDGSFLCSHSKSRVAAIRDVFLASSRSRLRFTLGDREGALGMLGAGWLGGLGL